MRATRRQLLAGGAAVLGGGALGAGGVLLAPDGPAPGAVTPGEALMTEHGVLKRVLLAYTAAAGRPWTPAVQRAVLTCAAVVRDYVEGFHEGLEEAYVFPPLLAAGVRAGTVRTLLDQHARGRRITATVLALDGPSPRAAALLRAFVRMYEVHEVVEDTEVYPAFRRLLGERRIAELGERFAGLDDRYGLEDVLGRLAPAEATLGAVDLAAVTPAV